jgi:endoglucanase
MGIWERYPPYEIGKVALPHSVADIEAGYSDGNSVAHTPNILNKIGLGRVRGLDTSDTHLNWTINEVNRATKVSARTHGARFIVNTNSNGTGPKRNPHPAAQGNEDLCNPPGRGLGPRPTTNTGYSLADAWLRTSPHGNSSGCGGGPPGGVFSVARELQLAASANPRLGPNCPSQP